MALSGQLVAENVGPLLVRQPDGSLLPLTAEDVAEGPPGRDGADGADGRTLYNGVGAPDDLTGVDGDFYFDTGAVAIYGPKAAGSWARTGPALLRGEPGIPGDPGAPGAAGADGADGAPGAAGADGTTLRSGRGAPSEAVGFDGEFYVDTEDWWIYGPRAGGVWPAGVSLIGPQGPTGDQGIQGARGDQGVQGVQGVEGRAGVGVPAGGAAGAGLVKGSGVDYDTRWVSLTKTFYTTHTWAVAGAVVAGSLPRHYVVNAAGQRIRLASAFYATSAGTVDFALHINDVDVSGNLRASSVEASLFAPAPPELDGDRIEAVIATVSADARDLAVTIVLEHTI